MGKINHTIVDQPNLFYFFEFEILYDLLTEISFVIRIILDIVGELVNSTNALLNNINKGTKCMPEYYDDLLKLRSWINWKY